MRKIILILVMVISFVGVASAKDVEIIPADYAGETSNPPLSQAYYDLGTSYFEKGDYEQAIDFFERVLLIDPLTEPSYEDVYFNLGKAYLEIDNIERARENFRRANRIYKISSYERARVVDAIFESLHLEESAAEQYYNEGIAYLHIRNINKAIQSFKNSISLVNEDNKKFSGYSYRDLGAIHLKQHEFKKAISSLKKAIGINPDDADAYFILGETYSATTDRGLSDESYQKAHELFKSQGKMGKAKIALLKKSL